MRYKLDINSLDVRSMSAQRAEVLRIRPGFNGASYSVRSLLFRLFLSIPEIHIKSSTWAPRT